MTPIPPGCIHSLCRCSQRQTKEPRTFFNWDRKWAIIKAGLLGGAKWRQIAEIDVLLSPPHNRRGWMVCVRGIATVASQRCSGSAVKGNKATQSAGTKLHWDLPGASFSVGMGFTLLRLLVEWSK
jgi:hypothetical protein